MVTEWSFYDQLNSKNFQFLSSVTSLSHNVDFNLEFEQDSKNKF